VLFPLLSTAVVAAVSWAELRRPWLFLVLGVVGLYILALVLVYSILTTIGVAGLKPGSVSPGFGVGGTLSSPFARPALLLAVVGSAMLLALRWVLRAQPGSA